MLQDPEKYVKSLNDGRSVFYRGKKIDDVASHGVLRVPVNHARRFFELRKDDALRKSLIFGDPKMGEVSGFFKIPRDGADLWYRSSIIQETTRRSNGLFNIAQAIGTDAINALLVVSKKLDADKNEGYFEKVRKYYEYAASNDLSLATAQTDVKGDRMKRPHEQDDPDMYLRVVDETDEGIVVNGAKVHTTQSVAANEIIFLPYRAMMEQDKDYAVAFSIPVNTKGLKLLIRPMIEVEGLPSREDSPLSSTDAEAESMTVLDNVLVPWDRVFMFKEWKRAGELANLFALYHRFTAISYRMVEADLYMGSARLASKVNGLKNVPHVREDLLEMILFREIMYMAARVASDDFTLDEGTGIAIPDPLYTNVGKLYSNANFPQMVKNLIDITGGLVSTLPGTEDFENPELKKYIEKYLKGSNEYSGEERFRVLRLIRELSAGPLTGYMMGWMVHAEGSVAASKIAMYRDYDFERSEKLASDLAGLGGEQHNER